VFAKKETNSNTFDIDPVLGNWRPSNTAIAVVTAAVITITLNLGAISLMSFVDKKLAKYTRSY
jgi:hypothetical protein